RHGWAYLKTGESADLHDRRTGRRTRTGDMRHTRFEYFAATSLLDGRFLMTGGVMTGRVPGGVAELYDPRTGRWFATGRMGRYRGYAVATLLPTGEVLVTGGATGPGATYASAQVYDSQQDRWHDIASMRQDRAQH